jgi:methyl-accepting chemotaxis protein
MEKRSAFGVNLSMTIGKKLTIGVSALAALILGMSYSSLTALEKLGDHLDGSINQLSKKLTLSRAMGQEFYELQAAESGAQLGLINTDPQSYLPNVQRFDAVARRIEKQIQEFRSLLATEPGTQSLRQIEEGLEAWLPLHEQYLEFAQKKEYSNAQNLMTQAIYPVLLRMEKGAEDLIQQQREALTKSHRDARLTISWNRWLTALLVGLAFGVGGVVILVARAISSKLRAVTGEMSAGADQVAAAASQVAGSSQALSQAASEQASSLEETSASSEEITSMTRKNAENAQAAARLATAVDGKVSEANHSLKEMITSMQEINTASDKISRIIKVIDEIAFQTNILALNAAVEAARAGEAGLGFAVVADEVRNLAQRSAQAAKDTAAMIEESISKSSEGSAKLNQVAEAIVAITESATKVKTLADEVNLGSQEQTRGMDQIAQAISRMEQVTQQTAASAEASASASEQLSSHASTMRVAAARLRAMVDGGALDNLRSAPQANRQASPASSGSKPAAANPKKSHFRVSKGIPAMKSPPSKPPTPSERDDFPPDGGEFREF